MQKMSHTKPDDSHEQEHQNQKSLINRLRSFKLINIARSGHATTLFSSVVITLGKVL